MIGTKKVLAVIAARGGSKGLPGKNVAPCGGRPMIDWTLAAAKGAALVDKTIVSSDDPAIHEAARKAGVEVPFVRPPHLATDEASMQSVIEHAVAEAGNGAEICVLLQVTSPLRRAEDIDGAIRLFERTGGPSVVGMTPVTKPPYWMYSVGSNERVTPLFPEQNTAFRRQDLPKTYVPNGAIYVFDLKWFFEKRLFITDESVAFVMPAERSVDVDTALDLALADLLLRS
jgi:N-acylneuraminate cytidylyltransferase